MLEYEMMNKLFCDEELLDLDERIEDIVNDIPKDKDGFMKGQLRIIVNWIPDA